MLQFSKTYVYSWDIVMSLTHRKCHEAKKEKTKTSEVCHLKQARCSSEVQQDVEVNYMHEFLRWGERHIQAAHYHVSVRLQTLMDAFLPHSAGSTGVPERRRLSGYGTVLLWTKPVMYYWRLEKRSLLWGMLLRPGMQDDIGLLSRLWPCLSRFLKFHIFQMPCIKIIKTDSGHVCNGGQILSTASWTLFLPSRFKFLYEYKILCTIYFVYLYLYIYHSNAKNFK